MDIQSLNGEWTLSSAALPGKDVPAQVPGCVHTDLLNADLIPDPYYRDNEAELQWIGESDWCYRRSFDVPAEWLDHEDLYLLCEGLDTLAVISLNGVEVARTDNMFRTWKIDVRGHLKQGSNEVKVCLQSTMPFIRDRQAACRLNLTGVGDHRIDGSNWIRKQQCNYGWDWGPELVTCGIWRSISLVGHTGARIVSVGMRQKHRDDASVELLTLPELQGLAGEGCRVEAELRFAEETIDHCHREGFRTGDTIPLNVPSPHLWWPNGLGEPHLYDLQLRILDARGTVLDEWHRRIGLRKFELARERDEWGESFHFRINGVAFFAKGANWIPADCFDARVADEDLYRLLKSAADAHMNCLRVWGGGLYERDRFYEICDQLGLCVWQDFMFACAAYPAHEPEFLQSVENEADDNVRRLSHHPSVVLWCGNNELEQIKGMVGDEPGAMSWPDYSALFDRLLRQAVERHHPEAAYWPSSEHSPLGNRTADGASQDPRWGDAHLWNVWHGREPFEWYRGSFHRFCSEFGFQSFPHPATVKGFTLPEDRSVNSRIMEWHQRSHIGNSRIITYMLDWFRLPVGFENTIWLSQILQGQAIKYAVEHWRRNMPRCMGALYWQLNDCWPVASWTSIDSCQRWKALQYEARRFFAPVLVSVVEDVDKQSLEVYVTNELSGVETAELEVVVEGTDGRILDEHRKRLSLPRNGSSHVARIAVDEACLKVPSYAWVATLRLLSGGEELSRNWATLVRPKHLDLKDPELRADVLPASQNGAEVRVTSAHPALWVWLDAENPDLRWSDNFFHLQAGESRLLEVRDLAGRAVDPQSIGSVRVRSLFDTYQESVKA